MNVSCTIYPQDVYVPPLKPEPGKPGVFLETEFKIIDDKIVCRLKNDNVDVEHPTIWRYQHFNSYAPYVRKKATITAALQKVELHASNEKGMVTSAIHKLKEFVRAGYPYKVLKYCCNRRAAVRYAHAWNKVCVIIKHEYEQYEY